MISRGAGIFAAALALCLAACGEEPAPQAASAEAPPAAPVVPPPPPADPLAVGSQEAKDDLYCAGVIFAANPSPPNALNPIDEAILRKAQALGIVLAESGINRLVAEKAAHATHGGVISDAYASQAARDLAAGKPRIPLDDCNARAKAMPAVE
jgi:ABC-type sugar transport system substrate-binding protein